MTYISVISTNIQVIKSLTQKIKESTFTMGIADHTETALYQFIDAHPDDTHLVFTKPVAGTMYRLCPTQLKTRAQVEVIMIVNHLPKEFLPFILKCLCIGAITPDTVETLRMNDLMHHIQTNGRLINHLISEKDWESAPDYVRPRPMPPISKREHQVLEYLCHGYDGKKIAQTIHTSVSNVRNIVASLKSKLNCQSEKEIMIVALANLWVPFKPRIINATDNSYLNKELNS